MQTTKTNRNAPKLAILASKATVMGRDEVPVTIGIYVANNGETAWKIDGPKGTARYYSERGLLWVGNEAKPRTAPKLSELQARTPKTGAVTKEARLASKELETMIVSTIG